MLTLLVLQLTTLVRQLLAFQSPDIQKSTIIQQHEPQLIDLSTTKAVSKLKSLAIFGVQTKKPLPTKAIVLTPPIIISRLNLEVIGVIAGPNAAAILKYNGQQKSYQLNDFIELTPQLKIQVIEINQQQISINNNGNRELIKFDFGSHKSPEELGITKALATKKLLRRTVTLPRSKLNQLLGASVSKVLKTNPSRLFDLVSASKVHLPNGNNGYKILSKSSPSVLDSLGLKLGDVISHVNRQTATKITFNQIQQLLLSNTVINLRVIRDHSTIDMDITI